VSLEAKSFCAIVVTYHTGESLNRCLAALLGDPLCAQIVIVNNGNPDPIAAGLRDMALAHSHVGLVEGQGNIGFGKACNMGAAQCRHDHLVFINPDCILDQQTLPALYNAFLDEPDAVLGGLLRNEDGSEQRGSRRGDLTLWSACVSFMGRTSGHMARL
jgi:N-acetylglucosaminyl-diphospho-decaprenol L-rhamnosyltransferase